MDYKKAGVDIEAGYKAVSLMKEHIASTMRPEVLTDIGGFSGAFSMKKFMGMEEPTLVSGTDGVGTKLKIAFLLDKHDTIGIDCVAMCVNDIACAGGEPLFFLDYIACGKNEPEKIAKIVSGVAEGCRQSDAALIGGETAEMPGFYPVEEYDLAGFSVGVVDKKDMITGKTLKAGDVLVGMASSGIHSNGYSLVRQVFSMNTEALNRTYESLSGTLGETLLTPTKIYVKALKSIKVAGVTIKACSHITGGGFYENIPRMLKEGTHAVIEKGSFVIPPIFEMLAKDGNVAEEAMYNTYNMGVGMITAVDKADVDKTVEAIKKAGEIPYVLGEIIDGEKGITLKEADLRLTFGKDEVYMTKTAVLVSGGGTNLQAIIDSSHAGKITNASIELVISNKPGAFALERASKNGIESKVIVPKEYSTREEYGQAMIQCLEEHQIDLVVLAGFLVILPENFVKHYEGRMINIHPSLIPSHCGPGYYGLKVHESVLARGNKVTGATVHFVNEIADGGPIISQKAVEVQDDDTPETLQRRVMEQAEWNILPQAIDDIANGRVEIVNGIVKHK